MNYRKYTKEFKEEAVQLMNSKKTTITQISRNLGVSVSILYRWRSELEVDPNHAFPGKGKLKPDEQAYRKLSKELEQTRLERDILKKAVAFFAKDRLIN